MGNRIIFSENSKIIETIEGETLLDAIRAAGLQIESLCSGRGVCGKCRVRVDGVEALACKTPAEDGMIVEILSSAEGQKILTDSGDRAPGAKTKGSGRAAIAIDIGTTTVVVKAVDMKNGAEIGLRAFTNPQRVYGADVLSRINHSMDDASMLSALIRKALDSAISGILREGDFAAGPAGPEGSGYALPEKVVIAGNTTMIYLLLNLRCRSIGLAPFEPEFAFSPVYTYNEVFGTETLSCPVLIYPYISSFVGGDIVSGLVNIEKHLWPAGPQADDQADAAAVSPASGQNGPCKLAGTGTDDDVVLSVSGQKEPCKLAGTGMDDDAVSSASGHTPSYMLVDMGTNGEIAYRNGERLFTTSTAAGPALEGGNITCGMSALPGAIYEVTYKEDEDGPGGFSYKTIDDKPAIGICGSGVISLVATLLDAGLVAETGAFSEAADLLIAQQRKAADLLIAQQRKAVAPAPSENEDLLIAQQQRDSAPAPSDTRAVPPVKQFVIAEADGNGGGQIVFTQKDVREFQLAKGAIRAGIEILIDEMGEPPQSFYLAGGFGQNIDLESAFRVGLIPRRLSGHISFVGNTSLGGCVDACIEDGSGGMGDTDAPTTFDSEKGASDGVPDGLRDPDAPATFDSEKDASEDGAGGMDGPYASLPSLAIIAAAREINLGAHKAFNDKFMETMMFDY